MIAGQIQIRIQQILNTKSESDGFGFWLALSHPYLHVSFG